MAAGATEVPEEREASSTDLSDLTMGEEEDVNGNVQVPPPVSRKAKHAREAVKAAREQVGLFHTSWVAAGTMHGFALQAASMKKADEDASAREKAGTNGEGPAACNHS